MPYIYHQKSLAGQIFLPLPKPKKSSSLGLGLLFGATSLLFMPSALPTPQNAPSATELTIASHAPLYFLSEDYQHGLGVDVARAFAKYHRDSLDIYQAKTAQGVVDLVRKGRASLGITHYAPSDLPSFDLGCGAVDFYAHGLGSVRVVGLNNALLASAQEYFCAPQNLARTKALAGFYDVSLWQDDYNNAQFDDTIKNQLPKYQHAFLGNAERFDHDWQLLAAIGYQESHLKSDAISPTGVRGIMMLTQDTAQMMGVDDRQNPIQSIEGGARYLQILNNEFKDIHEHERLWYVLAAYNLGPNALRRVMNDVKNHNNHDPVWADIYAYLSSSNNPRHTQCAHYVRHVRLYLERMVRDA